MTKNIQKKFDEEKKKGAPKVVPKRPIPYKVIEERFKALGDLRGKLNRDCRDLIAQLNMTEKKVFECDAQMSILREMMLGQPKPKPNPLSKVKSEKWEEAINVLGEKIKTKPAVKEGKKDDL